MMRGKLAAMTGAVLFLFLTVAKGQEAMPAHEHAAHGEHAAHEGHGPESLAMEDELPPRRSQNMLIWFVGALGWKYALFLPGSALLSFVLTAVLVIAGKGKTTGAAIAFVVALPFLIGLLGMFDGLISSFMVIAQSSSSPKPSEIAEGVATSIIAPMVAITLMFPSFILATVGLTIRSLKGDPKQ